MNFNNAIDELNTLWEANYSGRYSPHPHYHTNDFRGDRRARGGWADAVDNIRTEQDLDEIPDWVLDDLGLNRESLRQELIMKNLKRSYYAGLKKPEVKDYTDAVAAKAFFDGVKAGYVDLENFHKAFDKPLEASGASLSGLFAPDGRTHASMKALDYYGLDTEKASARAFLALWNLFTNDASYPTKAEFEAGKTYKQQLPKSCVFSNELLNTLYEALGDSEICPKCGRVKLADNPKFCDHGKCKNSVPMKIQESASSEDSWLYAFEDAGELDKIPANLQSIITKAQGIIEDVPKYAPILDNIYNIDGTIGAVEAIQDAYEVNPDLTVEDAVNAIIKKYGRRNAMKKILGVTPRKVRRMARDIEKKLKNN